MTIQNTTLQFEIQPYNSHTFNTIVFQELGMHCSKLYPPLNMETKLTS